MSTWNLHREQVDNNADRFLMGQADFGGACRKALLDGGRNVVGVFSPPHVAGRKADALRVVAEKQGLPVFPLTPMPGAGTSET